MIFTFVLCLLGCGTSENAPGDPCGSGPTPDVHALPAAFDVTANDTSLGTLTVPARGPALFVPKTQPPAGAAVAFQADLATYASAPAVDLSWDAGSDVNGVRSHFSCNRSVPRDDPAYAGAIQRRASRTIDSTAFKLTPLPPSP